MGQSTATVELAANALGVEPALIAKTMAFKLKDKNKEKHNKLNVSINSKIEN